MNTRVQIKDLTSIALLISVGYIVNSISPSLIFGLKPDFTLIFLFIIILVFNDLKLCLAASIATGIITALTTTFPGGQMPNLIDKICTGIIVYFFCVVLDKVHMPHIVKLICVAFTGSLLSGVLFLSFTSMLVGLPVSWLTLITTMLVPLTLLNTVVFVPLFHLIMRVRQITLR